MEGSDIVIDKLHNEILKKNAGPLGTKTIKIMDNCIDTSKSLLHYIHCLVLNKYKIIIAMFINKILGLLIFK